MNDSLLLFPERWGAKNSEWVTEGLVRQVKMNLDK